MKWIDKNPPLYVREEDYWERENDHKIFKADLSLLQWINDDEKISFPKKTRVFK